MGFRDIADAATEDILLSLGDDGVTLYNCVAELIGSIGGSGTVIDTYGVVMEERDIIDETGPIPVATQQTILLLSRTAQATLNIRKGENSILYDGTKYDIQRVVDDGLSQIEVHLEVYA